MNEAETANQIDPSTTEWNCLEWECKPGGEFFVSTALAQAIFFLFNAHVSNGSSARRGAQLYRLLD